MTSCFCWPAEHLEDLTVLGEDEGLFRLLDRAAPSPDAARNFLLAFHDENLLKAAQRAAEDADERSYVPEENVALRGLGEINAELVRRIAYSELGTSATLDHDATVIPAQNSGPAAWYRLNMLTYNVLVALKRRVLPPQQQTVKAKRLRFLIFDLAARITSHARTLYSHIKAATIERLTLFETRRWLQKLPREIAQRPRVPIPV